MRTTFRDHLRSSYRVSSIYTLDRESFYESRTPRTHRDSSRLLTSYGAQNAMAAFEATTSLSFSANVRESFHSGDQGLPGAAHRQRHDERPSLPRKAFMQTDAMNQSRRRSFRRVPQQHVRKFLRPGPDDVVVDLGRKRTLCDLEPRFRRAFRRHRHGDVLRRRIACEHRSGCWRAAEATVAQRRDHQGVRDRRR